MADLFLKLNYSKVLLGKPLVSNILDQDLNLLLTEEKICA